jgi:hypothetical protein
MTGLEIVALAMTRHALMCFYRSLPRSTQEKLDNAAATVAKKIVGHSTSLLVGAHAGKAIGGACGKVAEEAFDYVNTIPCRGRNK